MHLERVENPLRERVEHGVHPTGMHVTLAPKEGYSRAYGVLTVHFGSVDRRFVDPETGEEVEVPDGVAHFLEHKMFEDEQGDVSDRFSALGAHSNAATGFTTTSYLFSTTRNVGECVDLLLDFVQEPYFTDELVEKERGIIGQEIRMYDDDPSWRVYFALLQCLYAEHPVRINIAGSEESIARITPEILLRCHRAFYRPGNMSFCLVGAFDPSDVLGRIERDLAGRPAGRGGLHQREPSDLERVRSHEAIVRMDVGRPKLLVGFKDRHVGGSGLDVLRREVTTQILLDLAFGPASPEFERLYERGLIDDSFGTEYTAERDFGFAVIGGDTDDPDALHREILSVAQRAAKTPPDGEDLERIRRKYLGRFTQGFESLEVEAHALVTAPLRGIDPFASLELLKAVSPEDCSRRARELFDDRFCARSVVLPLGVPQRA